MLPGWTYNTVHDGVRADAAVNEVFLEALLRGGGFRCRRNGAEPVFLTPFPRDQAAMTADVLQGWQEARAAILRLAALKAPLWLTAASLLCAGI